MKKHEVVWLPRGDDAIWLCVCGWSCIEDEHSGDKVMLHMKGIIHDDEVIIVKVDDWERIKDYLEDG